VVEDVVVKKFTFAISSSDEFLVIIVVTQIAPSQTLVVLIIVLTQIAPGTNIVRSVVVCRVAMKRQNVRTLALMSCQSRNEAL